MNFSLELSKFFLSLSNFKNPIHTLTETIHQDGIYYPFENHSQSNKPRLLSRKYYIIWDHLYVSEYYSNIPDVNVVNSAGTHNNWENTVNELENTMNELANTIDELSNTWDDTLVTYTTITTEKKVVDNWENTVNELENTMNELANTIDELSNTWDDTLVTYTTITTEKVVVNWENTVNELENTMNELVNTIDELSNTWDNDTFVTYTTITTEKVVDSWENTANELENTMNELANTIDELSNTCDNKTLVNYTSTDFVVDIDATTDNDSVDDTTNNDSVNMTENGVDAAQKDFIVDTGDTESVSEGNFKTTVDWHPVELEIMEYFQKAGISPSPIVVGQGITANKFEYNAEDENETAPLRIEHALGYNLEIPSCIPTLSSTNDNFQTWETQDLAEISKFLEHGSQLTPLTSGQQYKLENLEHLRQLYFQISKINNNVKLDIAIKKQQIDQIQHEIDNLTKDEPMLPVKDDINKLIYKVSTRGPNYLNYTQYNNLQMFSSILSLRQPFTKQPIIRDQFILQFNGELYNEECLQGNDTQFIIDTLHKNLGPDRRNTILTTLKQLSGEFAIILIDLIEDKIYFGRDSIGKRSLCYDLTDSELLISSVSTIDFIECKNEFYEYGISSHELIVHKIHNLPSASNAVEQDETSLLDQLYTNLKQSTDIRYSSIHPLTHELNESKLAVLFSGGLDCTIIAGLICELTTKTTTTTIDLLTVGFDNPRTGQSSDQTPDRLLALKSWFHLQKRFPHIIIQLVEINVDYKSWLLHKSKVMDLIYPCNTEMDLSIAIAFYFASSKIPEITQMTRLTNLNIDWIEFIDNKSEYSSTISNYLSQAKVLFSGLGADELFAGYSRHESIFNSVTPDTSNITIDECYQQLTSELIKDIDILHTRNLGRDDRAISYWGKELRYPYLDEDFINWVIQCIPPQCKFRYEFKPNKKGKLRIDPVRKYLLRKLAVKMGLDWVSTELKRAIQFGAKSAKLELGQNKMKGTDRVNGD
ncbi:Asparagine synthetase domain-containing protein [Spathaspora sp. JA1]|nr:Asparagine synthetase domain-containing protein [Spathaspora sp. JA1]